jgi:hypothetical protein
LVTSSDPLESDVEVAVRLRSRLFILASLLLFDQHLALAASFTIQGENKIWDRSVHPNLDYFVAITNPSECSDWILSWQLNLSIHAVPEESTGKIFITDALRPDQNYLFANSTSHIFPAYQDNPNNTELHIDLIGDVAFDFETFTDFSAQVPKLGINLLDLKLSASEDARGIFQIVSIPSSDSTYWQTLDDFMLEPPIRQPFENLPFGIIKPVVIGTIVINNVPEPNALVSLTTIGILWIVYRFQKNYRR